jgi:hypothetical protein
VKIRKPPRGNLVRRSALLATAVTGVALLGSGVHGIAAVDGNLERAAAQRDARQLEQHRQAEQGRPPQGTLRYRELRGPRPGDCPFAGRRQRF